jgi:ribosomal protein S8
MLKAIEQASWRKKSVCSVKINEKNTNFLKNLQIAGYIRTFIIEGKVYKVFLKRKYNQEPLIKKITVFPKPLKLSYTSTYKLKAIYYKNPFTDVFLSSPSGILAIKSAINSNTGGFLCCKFIL